MFNSPNMDLQAGFDPFMPPIKNLGPIQIAVESPWKVPFFLIGTSSMVEFDGVFHLPSLSARAVSTRKKTWTFWRVPSSFRKG